jgi:signal transduction histidine kinase
VDPVKRRVLADLFLAPSVVLPMVGGLSAAMLSWAGGGVRALSAAAAAGILGGLGWMFTRMIFRLEQITARALQVQAAEQQRAQAAELDELRQQLLRDRDPRTQNYLTLLRSLRDEFLEAAERPGFALRSADLRERMQQIFNAAVAQLRETLRLRKLAQELVGAQRTSVQQDREKVLEEISETVAHMRTVVSHFKTVTGMDQKTDLAALRDELDVSLRVAKRTEQRMRELEQPTSLQNPDTYSRE